MHSQGHGRSRQGLVHLCLPPGPLHLRPGGGCLSWSLPREGRLKSLQWSWWPRATHQSPGGVFPVSGWGVDAAPLVVLAAATRQHLFAPEVRCLRGWGKWRPSPWVCASPLCLFLVCWAPTEVRLWRLSSVPASSSDSRLSLSELRLLLISPAGDMGLCPLASTVIGWSQGFKLDLIEQLSETYSF